MPGKDNARSMRTACSVRGTIEPAMSAQDPHVRRDDLARAREIARKHSLIVTVEEAYLAGGFGSAVLELLETNGLQDKVKLVRMGVSDEIVTHGDPKLLLGHYGLNADGIRDRVKKSLESLSDVATNKNRLRAVK